MLGRRLSLWLMAVLVVGASRSQAAPAASNSPVATCTRHLETLGRALAAYQRDHHALPPCLSDLYPRYVRDVNLLHCPADSTPGEPGYVGAKPDPNMPISYFFEMSLEKDPAGIQLGPEPLASYKTWRELKTAQRRYFGDRVPVVRCWHHTPKVESPAAYASTSYVLNLAPSGRVYRSIPEWERDPGTVATVLALMERDLKAGTRLFRHAWMPDPTARYITGLHQVTPETSLRLRAFADALGAAGQKDPAMANSGMLTLRGALYRTAGYTTKAIAALEKAVHAPGDHRVSAPLLAEVYHRTARDAEAVRFLQELVAKEPDDVLSMELLSHACEDDGQPEKADEWRNKVDHWLVGRPAPDFTLKDARGREVRLSEQRGKVVVLLFWNPSDPASGWEATFLEEAQPDVPQPGRCNLLSQCGDLALGREGGRAARLHLPAAARCRAGLPPVWRARGPDDLSHRSKGPGRPPPRRIRRRCRHAPGRNCEAAPAVGVGLPGGRSWERRRRVTFQFHGP